MTVLEEEPVLIVRLESLFMVFKKSPPVRGFFYSKGEGCQSSDQHDVLVSRTDIWVSLLVVSVVIESCTWNETHRILFCRTRSRLLSFRSKRTVKWLTRINK